jgi:NAD-dependent DNA ligase
MQLFLCVGVVYGLNNKANDLQLLHEEKIISVHSGNLVGFKNTEALVGYRFCLTGNHRRWPRNVLIKMIQCLGGEVVTSPRQANHILRADDVEQTIKLRIAAERGIKVVTVSELFHSLGDSILFGLHYC